MKHERRDEIEDTPIELQTLDRVPHLEYDVRHNAFCGFQVRVRHHPANLACMHFQLHITSQELY